MNQRKDYYDRAEAAKALGLSPTTVYRLVADGTLKPSTIVGNKYYYLKSDIEALKASTFPQGLTYRKIATRYGLAVNTVKRYFNQLKVQSLGHNRLHQSAVFDPDTVRRVARSLGWLENHSNEASSPAAAEKAISGLS